MSAQKKKELTVCQNCFGVLSRRSQGYYQKVRSHFKHLQWGVETPYSGQHARWVLSGAGLLYLQRQ